jgi:hypothetical protein
MCCPLHVKFSRWVNLSFKKAYRTYNETNSEHSYSWEADSRSSIQEIPRFLCTAVRGSLPCSRKPHVSILTQMNPVCFSLPYCSNIHFNIILPSTNRPSGWSLPFRFYNQIFHRSHAFYMPNPFHTSQFYLKIFSGEYKLWISSSIFRCKSKPKWNTSY